MTPADLAWIVLSWFVGASIWDIVDPDSAKVEAKSLRLFVAFLVQVAVIALCFTVVGASATLVVGYVATLLILVLLKLVVHGS